MYKTRINAGRKRSSLNPVLTRTDRRTNALTSPQGGRGMIYIIWLRFFKKNLINLHLEARLSRFNFTFLHCNHLYVYVTENDFPMFMCIY
jgi:hypothetical protein